MARTDQQNVKREQKKSFYLRELSALLTKIAIDEPGLAQIFITRIELSNDGGICYIYCSSYQGANDQEKELVFNEARELLVLYKPSMRKALASSMSARYVPNLRFRYDAKKEKELRINSLLDTVHKQLHPEESISQDEHDVTPETESELHDLAPGEIKKL